MSFEVSKVYTENPFVDEMVYYTKQLAMGTVLKLQDRADKSETVDSMRNGDMYISCVEGTVIFDMFDSISVTALEAAGITNPTEVRQCMVDRYKIPEDKRKAVMNVLSREYIDNYVELNPYYRMLHGQPPIGKADYVEGWIPPDDIIIDLSKPIHEMSVYEIDTLDKYGIIDQMIAEDPAGREYMYHLGDKAIDYYLARRAMRFDVLYIPPIDADAVLEMYRDKLDFNKFYVLRTVYSEAFKYDSDYYDNFIAVFIVLITMIDVISRVHEFIIKKEIFDIRSIQYLFESYGVPFFAEIPYRYQISMVKNLHTLLKYKSTAKCMIDICSLFGFGDITIFKYYLLKDRKVDVHTDDYIYSKDEDGNENIDEEYELKFLKMPLDADLDDYAMDTSSYMTYDELTLSDVYWDGGLDHEQIKKEILRQEFNFTRTKYISIDRRKRL